MKNWGIGLIAVGALMMVAAFFYSPGVHYSRDQRLSMAIQKTNAGLRYDGSVPTIYEAEDFPAYIHSQARAQRRELGFMGGGVALLAGVILFAAGSVRRKDEA